MIKWDTADVQKPTRRGKSGFNQDLYYPLKFFIDMGKNLWDEYYCYAGIDSHNLRI